MTLNKIRKVAGLIALVAMVSIVGQVGTALANAGNMEGEAKIVTQHKGMSAADRAFFEHYRNGSW